MADPTVGSVDLPANLTGILMGQMAAGIQLAGDDARDIRRQAHLTHQATMPVAGAMGYRLGSEAGSGQTRVETALPGAPAVK